MATREERFPSPWIKGSDVLAGKDSFTIKHLSTELVGQDKEEKTVLWFSQEEKGLILNVTNWDTIAAMYGGDDAHWVGKPIKLHTEKVNAFGETFDAVRVTMMNPGAVQDLEVADPEPEKIGLKERSGL